MQFPPPDGLPGEPGGILIQRRCAEVKINPGGSDRLKLFHRRFVLTAALEREGLVCVNDLTFPLQRRIMRRWSIRFSITTMWWTRAIFSGWW